MLWSLMIGVSKPIRKWSQTIEIETNGRILRRTSRRLVLFPNKLTGRLSGYKESINSTKPSDLNAFTEEKEKKQEQPSSFPDSNDICCIIIIFLKPITVSLLFFHPSFSFKHFNFFLNLLGRKFTLMSDQKALKFLIDQREVQHPVPKMANEIIRV